MVENVKEGELKKFCTFREFASKTVKFAKEYGHDVQDAILETWQTTGVLQILPSK